MDAHERLAAVTFHATRVDDLPYDDLRAALAAHTIVLVRGLFDRDTLRATLAGIAARFNAGDDQRHDPRDSDAVRRNFQKLQIGANSGVNTRRTLGRFMRVLYNPIFQPDILGMREHFVTLARFRNLLYGLPVDFAVHGTDDGFWTCARIMQYPRGGGFMVPHRDMYSQVATAGAGFGYFQPLLMLTEKGTDYHDGGAYIDIGEDRIYFEDACRTGDVVVYDGRTMHGVGDVDPMEPLDLQHFTGRAVAAVSLFKLLQPGGDDYARMAGQAREMFGAGKAD
jgi:hypothetical protein